METLISRSPAETEQAGEALAARLAPGDIIAFEGGLGMGKTAFVRGLARGLGSPDEVTSPTFSLIHEYRGGRLPLCHIDAWRLSSAGELFDTGFFDYLDNGWVCAVEWSERVREALGQPITVSIGRIDDNTREIKIMTGEGSGC